MNIKNIITNLKSREKISLFHSIFIGGIIVFCLLSVVSPQTTAADFSNTTNATYVAKNTNVAQKAVKTITVVATAYSSTPDQTDDTPFITASGKHVADNIIANNMLPFGTKVRIPKLYGNKIFFVQDRMNKRMSNYQIDLWMPDRESAMKFGVRTLEMEIL